MNAVLMGGSLDGRVLDVSGYQLHNLVFDPRAGRYYTEIYTWQDAGGERFLVLNEVKEGR